MQAIVGWMGKLNTNGSCRADGHIGCGALLEELMETGWEVFTKYVRHGKTYLAEL
jgi:hypothetical protein